MRGDPGTPGHPLYVHPQEQAVRNRGLQGNIGTRIIGYNSPEEASQEKIDFVTKSFWDKVENIMSENKYPRDLLTNRQANKIVECVYNRECRRATSFNYEELLNPQKFSLSAVGPGWCSFFEKLYTDFKEKNGPEEEGKDYWDKLEEQRKYRK